jgi:hypothetical protein
LGITMPDMAVAAAEPHVSIGQLAARALIAAWDALLVVLLVTPVALGWCVGFVVRVWMYSWGAALDGYHKGRGTTWAS